MSFHILTLFKIPIKLHFSFLILLGILSFNAGMAEGVIFAIVVAFLISAIFSCLVVHELAHALMARKFGHECNDITLYFMGGMASIKGDWCKKPDQEFWIAVSGPLSSAALAVLSIPFSLITPFGLINVFFGMMLFANTAIFIFNLLPIYPMDGGRIVKSILAKKIDIVKATKITWLFGSVLSVVLSIVAWNMQYYMAAFILPTIALLLGRVEYLAIAQEANADDAQKKAISVLESGFEHKLYEALLDFTDKNEDAKIFCRRKAKTIARLEKLSSKNQWDLKSVLEKCWKFNILEMSNEEIEKLVEG